MSLIPNCIVERKWQGAASRLGRGTLRFTAPNGEVTVFAGREDGIAADFTVHDWDVFRLAMARGDIGLGEAYIDGMWESSDIEALISLFLMNMDALDGFTDETNQGWSETGTGAVRYQRERATTRYDLDRGISRLALLT